MITHMVLLRLKKNVPQPEIDRGFRALASLEKKIPGIVGFTAGPYSSPEGLNKGFTHGFVMLFKDAAARDAYLPHPEHEKIKGVLLELIDGGLDGVIAFDYAS